MVNQNLLPLALKIQVRASAAIKTNYGDEYELGMRKRMRI